MDEAPAALTARLAGTVPDFLVWGAPGDVLAHVPFALRHKVSKVRGGARGTAKLGAAPGVSG